MLLGMSTEWSKHLVQTDYLTHIHMEETGQLRLPMNQEAGARVLQSLLSHIAPVCIAPAIHVSGGRPELASIATWMSGIGLDHT